MQQGCLQVQLLPPQLFILLIDFLTVLSAYIVTSITCTLPCPVLLTKTVLFKYLAVRAEQMHICSCLLHVRSASIRAMLWGLVFDCRPVHKRDL